MENVTTGPHEDPLFWATSVRWARKGQLPSTLNFPEPRIMSSCTKDTVMSFTPMQNEVNTSVYLALEMLCVRHKIEFPKYCIHPFGCQQINGIVVVNNRRLIKPMILFMSPFRPVVLHQGPHSVK